MRILLADDQVEVRSALRLLLDQSDGMAVVGEVAEAKELSTKLESACPDVVLLDWELPDLRAAESLVELRSRCPRLMVIALSSRPEARHTSLAAGADAFVSKGDAPEVLLATVDQLGQRDILQQ
ncbi:MAG: response regulator transcription factor [Dehalococcoidia bacterium]|nr:MAG: response regulator transcription factor [Dehalococcoidia bacterium]